LDLLRKLSKEPSMEIYHAAGASSATCAA